MTGSEFAKQILELRGEARERAIRDAIVSGNVPSWLSDKSQWRPIVSEQTIDGIPNKLVMRVSPDVASIGTDDDFLRVPRFPDYAQAVADHFEALLPSSAIAAKIVKQADTFVPAFPFGEPRDSTERYVQSNQAIQSYLAKKNASPSTGLIAGQKKDIVVGPNLTKDMLAIWGLPGWEQGYQSHAHDRNYVDYSHGVRLVDRRATLNGADVDLFYVFTSPQSHVLVSDQDAFAPVFPNKGEGCRGEGCPFPPSPASPLPPSTSSPSSRSPSSSSPTKTKTEDNTLAILVALGIIGGGIYLWKTS
jgi:hypothetical protein